MAPGYDPSGHDAAGPGPGGLEALFGARNVPQAVAPAVAPAAIPGSDAALQAVRTSMHEMQRAIAAARLRLVQGLRVDMTGMDGRTAELCAQVLDLPPPLARAMLPALLSLRDIVDGLIASLNDGSGA